MDMVFLSIEEQELVHKSYFLTFICQSICKIDHYELVFTFCSVTTAVACSVFMIFICACTIITWSTCRGTC